jgi:hypothetical protein
VVEGGWAPPSDLPQRPPPLVTKGTGLALDPRGEVEGRPPSLPWGRAELKPAWGRRTAGYRSVGAGGDRPGGALPRTRGRRRKGRGGHEGGGWREDGSDRGRGAQGGGLAGDWDGGELHGSGARAYESQKSGLAMEDASAVGKGKFWVTHPCAVRDLND